MAESFLRRRLFYCRVNRSHFTSCYTRRSVAALEEFAHPLARPSFAASRALGKAGFNAVLSSRTIC
jgi:hypothetical protein